MPIQIIKDEISLRESLNQLQKTKKLLSDPRLTDARVPLPHTHSIFDISGHVAGSIGTPGTQGFGVGIYPGTLPEGFNQLSGTTDITSDNYGNYQTANGSIMVFIPKFYYRIGSTLSPRYGVYGDNCIDIAKASDFPNETAANLAGYALHRAFIDGGEVKSGFFIDKYLACKDGNSSCKSVPNDHPISLIADANYTPSSTMVGCTGIYADSVVLSRARGYGFNVPSIFMYNALGLLSLAHGQYATASTYCAWYDATLAKNYPKGCNNNALADVDDTSVTFAVSYDKKPKTRATANFNKTTHNGQASGVTELNGSLWQTVLGITYWGTSGTDTTQVTGGDAYLLKTSSKLADLTSGWNTKNSAWGSETNLLSKYDYIKDFFPWGSSTTTLYFGNSTNQVFSGDVSGTNYLRTSCGVQKDTNGTGSPGTNLFGKDACYQYNRRNLYPLSCGHWDISSSAGVFTRYWGRSRSYSGYNVGFRSAFFAL